MNDKSIYRSALDFVGSFNKTSLKNLPTEIHKRAVERTGVALTSLYLVQKRGLLFTKVFKPMVLHGTKLQ